MQRKIEGLLVSKVIYKDRHVIGTLVLRNGKKVSVIFYGGRGGGKKKKSSILEIGYMMKLELKVSRSTDDLYKAHEWSVIWSYKKIRENFKAFYLLCSFAEIIGKMALKADLHDQHIAADKSSEGLFRVLSNAIFYLENELLNDQFDSDFHFLIFIGKVLAEQGIFPQRDSCVFCDKSLDAVDEMTLVAEKGGFSCASCVGFSHLDGKKLWNFLGEVWSLKYSALKDPLDFRESYKTLSDSLFQYFCFQLQLEKRSFKSLPMVL